MKTRTLAATAACATLFASACLSETAYTGSGTQKVAIVGDARIFPAAGELHAALDPAYLVRISAIGGISIAETRREADILAATTPQVAVIAVGVGDVWQKNVDPATSAAELQIMVGLFPSSCVVIVNLSTVTEGGAYNNAKAAQLNTVIAGTGARTVDWASITAADPHLLTEAPEHIVPNQAGQDVLAAEIASQTDTCFGD